MTAIRVEDPAIASGDWTDVPVLTGSWQETTGRLTAAQIRAALAEAADETRAHVRERWPMLVAAVLVVAAVAVAAVLHRDRLGGLGALVWPLAVITGLRATDVTLGVFKTTSIVQGRRLAAAVFAGSEALVWLTAAGIVLVDFSPARVAAFALGVASGTWLGMSVVHRLRLGLVTLRFFVPLGPGRERAGHAAALRIRSLGFGATLFDGEGMSGPVAMILTVVRRREAAGVCDVVQGSDERVLVTLDSHPGPHSIVGGVGGSSV